MKVAYHRGRPIDQECLAPSEIKAKLACKFPDLNAVERHRFVMVAGLAELIFAFRKSSTIRFSKGAVEYPSAQELPLFVVDDHRGQTGPTCIAGLQIEAVSYKTFAELNETDAHKDGFASRDDLVAALRTFYGDIQPDDVLSVFEFTLSEERKSRSHEPVSNHIPAA